MQIDVIDAKKTAMIVVDMQNDFVAAGAAMETPAARAVVPKLAHIATWLTPGQTNWTGARIASFAT